MDFIMIKNLLNMDAIKLNLHSFVNLDSFLNSFLKNTKLFYLIFLNIFFITFKVDVFKEISFLKILDVLRSVLFANVLKNQLFFELNKVDQFNYHLEIKVAHRLIIPLYIQLPTYQSDIHIFNQVAIRGFYTIW